MPRRFLAVAVAILSTMAAATQDYIVTFKPGTPKEMQEEVIGAVAKAGGEVRHRYTTVLLGFAGSITDAHVAELRQHDSIDTIEKDGEVHAMGGGGGGVSAF